MKRMLMLTRKVGDTIILEGDVEITVMDIQGSHVRISVNSPKEIKDCREEIYERLPD